jgi:hypothetical protein
MLLIQVAISSVTFAQQNGKGADGCDFRLRSPGIAPFGSESGAIIGSTGISPLTIKVIKVIYSGGDCRWEVKNGNPWVRIISGQDGKGSGEVKLEIASNSDPQDRAGLLTIAGKNYTIWQLGAPGDCNFKLETSGIGSLGSGFGAIINSGGINPLMVKVTPSNKECIWEVKNDNDWIKIISGQNGKGNGKVKLEIALNTDASDRIGRLTIAGKLYTIWQSGAAKPVTKGGKQC